MATTVVAAAFAASASAQISVSAGYGLMTQTGKSLIGDMDEDEDEGNVNLSGFYVNGSYEWKFLKKDWGTLALQPGITYQFGADVDRKEDSGIKYRTSVTEHYLDVPINVRYTYDLNSDIKLHAFAGPVLSFGLASIYKVKVEYEDVWAVNRLNLYNGKYSVKSSDESYNAKDDYGDSGYSFFDLKLGIGFGVTFKERYSANIGYNFGLLNRTAKVDAGYVSHTHVLQVGIGYNF